MVIMSKAKDIRFFFNVHCNLVKYNDKVIEEGKLYMVIREQSLWQSSIWGTQWRIRWNLSGEEPGKSWLGRSDSMWKSPKLKKHPYESGEQKNARVAEEYWSKGKTHEAELEGWAKARCKTTLQLQYRECVLSVKWHDLIDILKCSHLLSFRDTYWNRVWYDVWFVQNDPKGRGNKWNNTGHELLIVEAGWYTEIHYTILLLYIYDFFQ